VYGFLLSFNEEINFLCISFMLLTFLLVLHLDMNGCFILQFLFAGLCSAISVRSDAEVSVRSLLLLLQWSAQLCCILRRSQSASLSLNADVRSLSATVSHLDLVFPGGKSQLFVVARSPAGASALRLA
jgi:hypothetical protein